MNTLRRKCPRCHRLRKFRVPPDHRYPQGLAWQIRDDRLVCGWCVARETPDGERALRLWLKALRTPMEVTS